LALPKLHAFTPSEVFSPPSKLIRKQI